MAEGQSLSEYIVILPPTQLGEASTSFAVTLDIEDAPRYLLPLPIIISHSGTRTVSPGYTNDDPQTWQCNYGRSSLHGRSTIYTRITSTTYPKTKTPQIRDVKGLKSRTGSRSFSLLEPRSSRLYDLPPCPPSELPAASNVKK